MAENQSIPTSCAELASELIVSGCLPMIQGKPQGKAPIEPLILTKAERAKLVPKEAGLTLFYPAGEGGVFLDVQQTGFVIWFSGDDTERVTSILHGKLAREFPNAKQLDDVAHQTDERMRARVYRIDLGSRRFAVINTSFADIRPSLHKFEARVSAEALPT